MDGGRDRDGGMEEGIEEWMKDGWKWWKTHGKTKFYANGHEVERIEIGNVGSRCSNSGLKNIQKHVLEQQLQYDSIWSHKVAKDESCCWRKMEAVARVAMATPQESVPFLNPSFAQSLELGQSEASRTCLNKGPSCLSGKALDFATLKFLRKRDWCSTQHHHLSPLRTRWPPLPLPLPGGM